MNVSAPTRLNQDALERLVGREATLLLERRHRGGLAGLSGSRYEEIFGAHRIARLARKLFAHGEDAVVEWQSQEFVDDFVVRRDERRSFKAYQLKNSPNVSWTAGNPSIALDFERQHLVSSTEGYVDVRLRLVCSNEETSQRLCESVPDSVKDFSSSFSFPYSQNLLPLFFGCEWLSDDFAFLSKFERPKKIEIANVASILIGAWNLKAPTAKVSNVIQQARETSPTLIRSLRTDADAWETLLPQFRTALNGIAHFQYKLVRGFLNWTYLQDTMEGTLSFDCFTDQFKRCQEHVIALKPTTFQEIEGVLL